MKQLLICIYFLFLSAWCNAQNPEHFDKASAPPGTNHPLSTIEKQKAVPLPNLINKDVVWSKRIWRKIDLKEKMNHIYYYPVQKNADRESLFQALLRGVLEEGVINAYEDDELKVPISRQQIISGLNKYDTAYVEDPSNPEIKKRVIYKNEFNSASIKQFRIKEDWYYDPQLMRMHVRIVSIAPVQEILNPDGSLRGYKILFWVYYPQARSILATTEAFNRHNDAARLSYDDMFLKRFFSSFVYKEIDITEKMINEYEAGIEALMQTEKIKEEILNYEVTLWEF